MRTRMPEAFHGELRAATSRCEEVHRLGWEAMQEGRGRDEGRRGEAIGIKFSPCPTLHAFGREGCAPG